MSITNLWALIGAIGAISLLMHIWLDENQKDRLREYLKKVAQDSEKNPIDATKVPLRMLYSLLTAIFKVNPDGDYRLGRLIVISLLLLFMSLGVAGIVTDTTFGFKEAPWQTYQSELDMLKRSAENKDDKELEGLLSSIDAASQPAWKWVYTAFLIIVVLGMKLVADILSFRWVMSGLRDMIGTESPFLLTGGVLVSLLISFLMLNFFLLATYLIANPLMFVLYKVGFSGSVGALLIAWGISVIFSWIIGPAWMLAVSLSAVLPGLTVFVLAFASRILYSIRRPVGAILNPVFDKALSFKQGPLLFFACLFGGVAQLIKVILDLYQ